MIKNRFKLPKKISEKVKSDHKRSFNLVKKIAIIDVKLEDIMYKIDGLELEAEELVCTKEKLEKELDTIPLGMFENIEN